MELTKKSTGGGGGATPGGNNTDVQYNSSGSFAGDDGLQYVINPGSDNTLFVTAVSGDNAQLVLSGDTDNYLVFENMGHSAELGHLAYHPGSDTVEVAARTGSVSIVTDSGLNNFTWTFDSLGNLTLPGASVLIKPDSSRTTGLTFTMIDGTTPILTIDSVNDAIVVGNGVQSGACVVEMISTTLGCGVPNMTTTQKNAITPNRAGNIVFDTTLGKLCVNNGTTWETITSV